MIEQFITAFNKYQGNNKTTDKIAFQPHLTIWREKDSIKVFELRVKQMGVVSMVISTTAGDEDKATVPVGILTETEQKFILGKVEQNEIN